MDDKLLHKSNTGISAEFFVAAELARRGFNVTLTFGNTKSIDLIIEKEGRLIPVQVKGIQRIKSICWNISMDKLDPKNILYILVNLNADSLEQPEYFILTENEVREHFKPTNSKRDYLDYNYAKKLGFQDAWHKI
jgi:predicted AAA+ superfamily ATPase